MRRIKAVGVAAMCGVVITALAGCSSAPEGNPTPSVNTPPSTLTNPSVSGTTLPYAGAPKVANPLPASVLSGDPCTDALTPERLKTVIGTDAKGETDKGKRDSTSGIGLGCNWANTDTGSVISVSYVTETHVGLSGVYQNTKPGAKIWKELTIEGFPAVAHAQTISFCQLSVGLADDLSLDVSLNLSDSKRNAGVPPCDVAPGIAELMVRTLKEKAGA